MKRLPIGIQDNKYMMEADQGDRYTDYETVISVPVPLIPVSKSSTKKSAGTVWPEGRRLFISQRLFIC